MQQLTELFEDTFHEHPRHVEPLPKAGSNRRYFRLTGKSHQAIGVAGTSLQENQAFLYLARHLLSKGLPVPEVFAVSADSSRYLQEDCGRLSLADVLQTARESGVGYGMQERGLVEKAVRLLPHVQLRGAEGLEETRLMPPSRFDAQSVMFDLNYFKYCFLRTTDVAYDEIVLQQDMERFAEELSALGATRGLLYRDFQSRNVLLKDGELRFIDFQGARLGPLTYDLASFLWQASARFSDDLREAMVEAYLDELRNLTEVDAEAYRRELRLMVLFRLLQVLGAYGLRGRFERKAHFLASIPLALAGLHGCLGRGACAAYPGLESVLYRLTSLPEFAPDAASQPSGPPASAASAPPTLVVRVFSFSYKKGIPADESGHGGGYVFDCRAPHNPGRYEAYRHLTGLDAPVVRFLEDGGEVRPLLEHAFALADFHVRRYMERGFTSLMFCFGCTGGQHRSVYCAQRMAEHLNGQFGVEVHLEHREQGIRTTFPATPRPAPGASSPPAAQHR